MIEQLDLGQPLPRLDRRRLMAAASNGVNGILDELVSRWNEAMQSIEERLNSELGQKINYVLERINSDVVYLGSRDSSGDWITGTYRLIYDSDSGELQIQRYLGGNWLNVHRFSRDS